MIRPLLHHKLAFLTICQILNVQSLSETKWFPNSEQIKFTQVSNTNIFLDFNSDFISPTQKINLNQSDLKEAIIQFDIVANKLNELQEQLNNDMASRQKRATPRENIPECVVSKTELNDLSNVINTSIQNLPQENVNCAFTSKNNDCKELLKLIQCGITNIKSEFDKMINNNVSSGEYIKLSNAYEILYEKYLKIKDEVKVLSDKKYKQQMDKLTKNMQKLAETLNDSIATVITQTINYCAAEIHIGNIENSIKEYYNLKYNNKISILSKIVDKAYPYITDKNKDDNVQSLMSFIGSIRNKCEQFTIYLSLIGKMQEKNHFSCLASNSWEHLKRASKKWNLQLSTEKITECPRNFMENFNAALYNIAKYIYIHCYPNAENALQFVDELLTNDQKVVAYPIIFEEMKKRNNLNGYEIVLLGYRIQEVIITQNSENLENIMRIKKELPAGVNVLISAGAIRLKSKALINSNFGLTYMKKMFYRNFYVTTACTESVDQYQDWIIRVHQRGRYFQFLNVGNAHSLRTNETNTFVTTGFCERHLWEIIPIANGESFYIKNKYYGNVLGVNMNQKIESCYRVQVFNRYTGDNYQQWEIKHKI